MTLNKLRNKNNQQGFTLIEVLIAAIILFSAIALVAELFSASSLSSKKAAKIAQYNQTIPLANRKIQQEVLTRAKNRNLTSLQGSENLFGINFTWRAERIAFLPPARQAEDEDSRPAKFGLFTVVVDTEQGSRKAEYQFDVATW